MITIAWDVDDVLNDLMRIWFEQKWLKEHPECTLVYEEIVENPPNNLLGVKKEEYQESLDEFRLSSQFQEMLPDFEVKDWFVKYGSKFRHIALTSVPLNGAQLSARWVLYHFGKWIRNFSFIPSPRTEEQIPKYDRTKIDYLKWLNKVDVLIEDNDQNIYEAEKLGIRGILVRRPWNKSSLLMKNALLEINEIVKKDKND